MLPIKIENGKLCLNIDKMRKLSPRQIATLNEMESRYGTHHTYYNNYLYSLLGLTKKRVEVVRIKSPSYLRDELSHKSKGSILAKFQELLYNGDDAEHRPSQRNVGQWLGVEIECFIPHDSDFDQDEPDDAINDAHASLARAIKKAGIPRASVKYDGSLGDDEGHGVEVTILFNAADGFEPLNKLCRVLNAFGCYVNKSCGLHVHLDARHLKPKNVKLIGRRLGRSLPVLKWIVDKSRHTNTYCELSTSKFSSRASRYHAINLTSFFKYKTIEVRLHGGSTNATKIRHWIETLQFLSNVAVPKVFTTFQQLIDLGLPEHLVEYADKRINKLNPDAWSHLTPPVLSNIHEFSVWPRMEQGAA